MSLPNIERIAIDGLKRDMKALLATVEDKSKKIERLESALQSSQAGNAALRNKLKQRVEETLATDGTLPHRTWMEARDLLAASSASPDKNPLLERVGIYEEALDDLIRDHADRCDCWHHQYRDGTELNRRMLESARKVGLGDERTLPKNI